jgi:Mn2+/Fe2+ NRAMP family transporter
MIDTARESTVTTARRKAVEEGPQHPPSTILGTLRRLGPGLILAGAIVGSGELIATTRVGAEAGFWLLWIILLGCTLKVFTQIEFGRYAITWSRTTLDALDTLPGPRFKVNWLVWYWFVIVLLIISQNGGIVGGVGQALAILQPLSSEGVQYNQLYDQLVGLRVELAMAAEAGAANLPILEQQVAELSARVDVLPQPADIAIWATLTAVLTSALMYIGRYGLIQVVTTVLVGSFTVITIASVVMLQSTEWAIQWSDVVNGLRFTLPTTGGTTEGLATALAAFGMIGLSAGEIIMYPYWCLEKGYAQWSGPRDSTDAWATRARGWMRVMHVDAWLSMGVYTISTVAFYLLGAAVLSRAGLNVEGEGLIRTLAEMYVPVLGPWAESIFLIGAVTILYSTYFVFAAGFARIIADSLILLGLIPTEARVRWIRIVGVALPLAALVTYFFVRAPVAMILAAGLGQSTILPMLGGAALYFRYKRIDVRLRPGLIWDLFLWISVAGLLVAGVYSIYGTFFR